ncbi:MAG TPA: alpha/beta hydrolase [Burkholderiales bacterium]|nr:alpha/beta hydrolase [Burkholderiales bacterium]
MHLRGLYTLIFLGCLHAAAYALEPLGTGMEGFEYSYPVRMLSLTMEGAPVRLAYMDVSPSPQQTNGRTVVLLHGRNFFGAYWKQTIEALQAAGYRVIVPDQIGFGKSSKPDVPHSFQLHAMNLRSLVGALGVEKVHVVAHSIGGMMAIRFALMYPEMVDKLVLESPIGLEDYRILVPYATREQLTREHLETTREAFDKQFHAFFAHWQPEFQVFPDVQAAWLLSSEPYRIARTAAHTWLMAYEQPVVYELGLVRPRTLLTCGDQDHSAIGRNRVPPEVRDRLGRYTELCPRAAAALPRADLVMFNGVGHVAHLEVPERFNRLLLEFLARP